MVKTFCTSGEKEALKGAVHASGGLLAALMATYNIAAWCYRRERHLGVNAIVYTIATLWEAKQTAHHFERLEEECGPNLALVKTTVAPPSDAERAA